MTTDALPLEPVDPPPPFGCHWLPAPNHYSVDHDRSVIELAARFGPLTTLRSRLTLTEALLDVHPDTPERSTLSFALDSASARRRALRGRRGLDAEHHAAVRFTARELEPREDGDSFTARGTLLLRGKRFRTRLHVRVVDRTDHSLLMLGTATLPYR